MLDKRMETTLIVAYLSYESHDDVQEVVLAGAVRSASLDCSR